MNQMESGAEPVYSWISRTLEKEIRTIRHPGEQLESEGDLAQRFNVNRHTLRRAVDQLVQMGLVERRRGVGLFVLEQVFDYPLHAETRMTANLENMGVSSQRKVLRRFVIPASPKVAERLGVIEGTDCYCLATIASAKERSLSVSDHYFVQASMEATLKDYQGGSLHQFLAVNGGLKLKRVHSTIIGILPTPEDASQLRIPRTLPVLQVCSLNVDAATGKPVEYVESRFRSDRIELSVRF